jgi:peptide/nickel transport system permease protein
MIRASENRALRKLRRHSLAMWGLGILAVLYCVMALAEFIAPYGYDNGRRDLSYVPPSAIHFVHNGLIGLRPFVCG